MKKGIGDNMLQANYGELDQEAKEINQAANDYIKAVNDLYKVVDDLQSAWEGADNLNFVNTVNGYKTDITDLGKIVNNYANFLDKSVEVISNTQQDISDAAGRL